MGRVNNADIRFSCLALGGVRFNVQNACNKIRAERRKDSPAWLEF